MFEVVVGVLTDHFRFLGRCLSRLSIRFASHSSQRCHVGIQASTAARHRGFERSSASLAPFSRCSSRNFMRCFVTISTLRRTECHEYGCFWPRVNSIVTVIHHLHRFLRTPKLGAYRLHISKRDTSSLVVSRLPCLRCEKLISPEYTMSPFPALPFLLSSPLPFSARSSTSMSPSRRGFPGCPVSAPNSGSPNASAPLISLVPETPPRLSDRSSSSLSIEAIC